MAETERPAAEILNDMALKIVMVEPGDLSMVGELLELAEHLVTIPAVSRNPVFHGMGSAFKQAVENVIMGELADSAANYDLLGQCISHMQEAHRKGEDVPEKAVRRFCDNLAAVGFKVDTQSILGDGATQEKAGADAEKTTEESAGGPAGAAAEPPAAAGAELPDFLQDKELLSGFIEEAFEHLETIEVNVLELEQNQDDPEIINNIFRPFHTIKGVSGFLNLKNINALAHATENLLDGVRNGQRAMDSEVIDIVLNVGDYLRAMVQNIKDVLESGPDQYQEYDIGEYLDRIRVIESGGAPQATPAAPPGKAREEAAPPPSEPEPAVAEASSAAPKAPPPPKSPPQPLKQKTVAGGAAPGKKKLAASIKVDVEKLDSLVNAVGELVIMQAMVRQNPLIAGISDPKLTRDLSQLARITTELQKTAMAMRMVPIRQTFQKMIRLVRDLSKKSKKKVDLIMAGEDTEIDRNMVDSIYDPLVHMIRNSVDHGVKTPAEREKDGKPGVGVVNLRAYQKGGNIVIEIEDDGEGLNTEKIRSKAIERGLVQESESLSDYELNNLIFLPGFSTADKITDVSGRGVGMDVVKKAVEKMRGKVEVISLAGKGSQFIIRLPLTLAIIDGIIVRVGSERYIIPTVAIQESMKPRRENYNTVHGKGETLLIRGSLIPIIRLYEVFDEKPTYTDPCDAIVVVVENEGRLRALMVDELLGKQEVVIKSLGGYMKDVTGVAGGTILSDGMVGLILDLDGLIAASADLD